MYSCLGPVELKNLTLEEIEFVFQKDKSSTYLFPSHFFEVNEFQNLLTILEKASISFRVQISLGKELIDYFSALLELQKRFGEKFSGLEIVIDRKLNPFHLQQLDSLQKGNIPFRFLAIPFSDRDPFALFASFPSQWKDQLFVFFPEKQIRSDSHLTNDEKALLEKKIEIQVPGLILRPHSSIQFFLEERRLASFLQTKNAEASFLEQDSKKKRLFLAFLKIRFLRPVIVIPYALLWICHDPKTALSMPLRYLRAPTILAYKFFDLFVWLGYRAVEVLYLIRHIAVFGYVYVYRFLSFLHRSSVALFYLVYPALRNPLWFLECQFPTFYKFTFFPFCKIYWFLDYQIRKRLLFSEKGNRWSQ